jgi:dihydrofolate reductase
MANIKLFIATSIDGYIARLDGSLDWLDDVPNPDNIDHGYRDFYSGIGTLFMGRKTYEAILGMDVDWPYEDAKTYILTRNADYTATTPHTYVINEDILGLVEEIREEEDKDIWLVGGGELVSMFMDLKLIDEMILSVIPVVLGSGIPLFASDSQQVKFKLLDSRVFETGIINLHYAQNEEN